MLGPYHPAIESMLAAVAVLASVPVVVVVVVVEAVVVLQCLRAMAGPQTPFPLRRSSGRASTHTPCKQAWDWVWTWLRGRLAQVRHDEPVAEPAPAPVYLLSMVFVT
jgi:hypothetical protein